MASGVLLPGLKLGAEESRHHAILVGGMDMKQRPWVGSVKANHAAGAKARRGPQAWGGPGDRPWSAQKLPCRPSLDSQIMTYVITAAAGTGSGRP